MSALLRSSVLQTVFRPNGNAVHTITDQDGTAHSEHWKRQRLVGRGAFADVWLEQCVEGHPEVELRAVKEIHKSLRNPKAIDYHRELEVILRFSQRKVKPASCRSVIPQVCHNLTFRPVQTTIRRILWVVRKWGLYIHCHGIFFTRRLATASR